MKRQTDMYSLNFFISKASKVGMWLVSLIIIHNLAVPTYLTMNSKQHKAFFELSKCCFHCCADSDYPWYIHSDHPSASDGLYGGPRCSTFIGVKSPLGGANVQEFAHNKVQASLWHPLQLSSSLRWPPNGNSGKQVYLYWQGCNRETPDLWPVSWFHRANNELIQEMCLLSKRTAIESAAI